MLTVLLPQKPYFEIITILTASVAIRDVISVYFKTDLFKNRQLLTFQVVLSKSTSFGITATSKHSLFKYWALAHYWLSMFTRLLDNSEFTFYVTTRSDCIISIILFNLLICCNTLSIISRHFRLHIKYNNSQILLR